VHVAATYESMTSDVERKSTLNTATAFGNFFLDVCPTDARAIVT